MRRTFAVLACLAVLSLPALAADDEAKVATLSANGEGSVEVVPDILVVSLGVTSRGRTASAALAANSDDMAKVLAGLKDAGIADKDIGTSGFNVNPVYAPQRSDGTFDPTIVDYEVQNQVRVTLRDLAASGTLLDKVVGAGANQINGIGFDVTDRVKPAEEALKAAIADARHKADLMAEAAGVKIIRVLSITGGGNGGFAPAPMLARADKAVPIMAGQQSIAASASLVFEIAPK